MSNRNSEATTVQPRNRLVQEQPADTLTACANVMTMLMDLNDSRVEAKAASMSPQSKDGAEWISMMVIDALRYEASRA